MESEAAAIDATAALAAAIAEPARARILFSLLDGCSRTSTELALAAEVAPSTASAHLGRLRDAGLVAIRAQGKHRYYSLAGVQVAQLLESLHVLAAGSAPRLVPTTPLRLRSARTCYDHLAGALGVALHERLTVLGWLTARQGEGEGERIEETYEVTLEGALRLEGLGVDLATARARRRRFAVPCLDWSERRPHLGGALGAALFDAFVTRGWVVRDLDSRAVSLTDLGQRRLKEGLGLAMAAAPVAVMDRCLREPGRSRG